MFTHGTAFVTFLNLNAKWLTNTGGGEYWGWADGIDRKIILSYFLHQTCQTLYCLIYSISIIVASFIYLHYLHTLESLLD